MKISPGHVPRCAICTLRLWYTVTYTVRQCTVCRYEYVFTPARRNVRGNNYDHWRHKLGMESEFNLI